MSDTMKIYVELFEDRIMVSKNSHNIKANNYDKIKYTIDMYLVDNFLQNLKTSEKTKKFKIEERRYGDSIIIEYIQLRLEKTLLGIVHDKSKEDFIGIIHDKIKKQLTLNWKLINVLVILYLAVSK